MKKFKDFIIEKINTDDIVDAFYDAMDAGNKKFDLELWDYLETETADSGIYAGDATPDELLSALSDKQLLKAYEMFSKKYKGLFKK